MRGKLMRTISLLLVFLMILIATGADYADAADKAVDGSDKEEMTIEQAEDDTEVAEPEEDVEDAGSEEDADADEPEGGGEIPAKGDGSEPEPLNPDKVEAKKEDKKAKAEADPAAKKTEEGVELGKNAEEEPADFFEDLDGLGRPVSIDSPNLFYPKGSLGPFTGQAVAKMMMGGFAIAQHQGDYDNIEPPDPGSLSLIKTAEQLPGTTDQWKIKLELTGKDLPKTSDIVLVVDRSGSMAGNRMTSAKSAAKSFVNTLLKADDPSTRIALVSYSSDYSTAKAITVHGGDDPFKDYGGKNYLNEQINGLVALGGTHTQAALRQARLLLDNSSAENRYIVLLSDGEPTYSYGMSNVSSKLNPTYFVKQGTTNTWHSRDDLASNVFNYNSTVGTGNSMTQQAGTTGSGRNVQTYYYHNGNSAVAESRFAKNESYIIYSIGLDMTTDGQDIMERVANPGNSYPANTTNLEKIFKEIASDISFAATNAVVTDPIGEKFTLADNSVVINRTTYSVSSDKRTITWNIGNISEGNPATMEYIVEIKSEAVSGQVYPTNGHTYVDYKNAYDDNARKSFDVPEVGVKAGTIKVHYYRVNAAGQPMNSSGEPVNKEDAKFRSFTHMQGTQLQLGTTYTVIAPTSIKVGEVDYQYNGNNNVGDDSPKDVILTPAQPSANVWFPYSEVISVKVTFDENYEGALIYSKTTVKGTTLGSNMPDDPTRQGYTFKGWNTNVDGNGTEFDSETIVNSDITVYAQWERNIGPAITVTGYEGEYDGDPHTITVGGTVTGDVIHYSTDDGESWSTTNPEYTDVGEYPVKVKVTNPNYADRLGEATVKITPKAVTITVHDKLKVYGGADPEFTGTVAGLIAEEDLGEITYFRTNDSEAAGSYPGVLDADYTENSNYAVTVHTGNFTITKGQGPAITVTGYEGEYDGDPHTITVGGTVTGDVIHYSTDDGESWSTTNPEYTDVGEYPVKVKVTNPNYADRLGEATVKITPKAVTITVHDKLKIYGELDPVLTGTVSGIVAGDDLKIAYIRTNTTEDVGVYEKVLSATYDEENPNYEVTVMPGNFTILSATIEVTKEGQYIDGNEDGIINAGDRIDYTIIVTNTGDVTLTDIEVVDDKIDLSETIDELLPGESKEIIGSYTFSQDDLDSGSVINNVIVRGLDPNENPVEDEDKEETPLTPSPAMTIVKEGTYVDVDEDGVATVADRIDYTITVTNTGNVTLTNIVVNDPKLGLTRTIDVLAPGESKVIEDSYTLTEEDIFDNEDRVVVNTVTAQADQMEEPVDDEEITELPPLEEEFEDQETNPAMTLVKKGTFVDVDGDGVATLADRIDYKITVTNTGDVDLTNIKVIDKLLGLEEIIAKLAPGESKVIEKSYTLTEKDIFDNDDRIVVNRVSAEADELDEPVEYEEKTKLPELEEEFEDVEEEEDEPKLPKTGEVSSLIYYGAGLLLVSLGIGFGRKRRKNQ
ncbi:MAG: VWA domain-containing protein [Clostridiales bacterium]|nr:VWA domain-containing protein [Clostridiales bacterium]